MKILFVYIADSQHVNGRARYLLEQGHDVHYLGFQDGLNMGAMDDRIKLHYFPSKVGQNKLLNLIHRLRIFRRFLRKQNYDIIHIMSIEYGMYAFFCRNTPVVIENTGSDVLVTPKKSRLVPVAYKLFYALCSAVVQDSKVAQEAGLLYGAPKEKNRVIEIGIDCSVFTPELQRGTARSRLSISSEQPMIYSPRAFREIYNIDSIIKAIPEVLEQFPRAIFVFSSYDLDGGDLTASLNRLIDNLGVRDSCRFTGRLDNLTEMPHYYRDSDVVLSVPTSDSSPRSVYEALSCGTNVVASDLEWVKGRLEDGKELFLVPPKDSGQIAKAVSSILENRSGSVNTFAREYVLKHIDYKTHGAKLEELYSDIVKPPLGQGKNLTLTISS